MTAERRKFNGINYDLFKHTVNKSEAERIVNLARDKGLNSRFIKGKHENQKGYHIYIKLSEKRINGLFNRKFGTKINKESRPSKKIKKEVIKECLI
jgi:hypothetical protein